MDLKNPDKEVVWQPLPGSQVLALTCPCDEIIYHGTRGCGKSIIQLAYFLSRVGLGYGAAWRGIIFDRGYKNLDDLIAKAQELIPKVFPNADFKSSKSDLKWVFPGGEELLFRHVEKAIDYRKYHGHEYPYIGFNELTSYPTSEVYDLMASCNRSSFLPDEDSPGLTAKDKNTIRICREIDDPIPPAIADKILPEIPLVRFSTTNPHGAGHGWVKRHVIDKAAPGVPIKTSAMVFNPRTQTEELVTTTRVHIFGSYKENRFLDAKYVAFLNSITDPNKRAAWFGGDWSISSGGALDDLWTPSKHVVPRFKIPHNWPVFRAFDWGSTHPHATVFYTISNGEEFQQLDGSLHSYPAGSYIFFDEIYGCQRIKDPLSGRMVMNFGSNKGVKESARVISKRIKNRQKLLVMGGWLKAVPQGGPADGQIYNNNESETDSIGKKMAKEGIRWHRANKAPGTRKLGLQFFRDGLEASKEGEQAGIYVTENCECIIETVPSLPRDEKDPDVVMTDAEDHLYDAIRYALLDDKPVFAKEIEIQSNVA